MSTWDTLAGNRRVKEQLGRREDRRGLSHAYILAGPEGSGRHTLARLLSAAFVCSAPVDRRPCGRCPHCKKAAAGIHPDITVLTGPAPGKPITVDQIRALRADAYVRPNEGERKVYLLEQADTMAAPAQNAMLKLLEEGPEYAAFLLLARQAGGLLQTVRSRCEELVLSPVPHEEAVAWLHRTFPDRGRDELDRAAMEAQGILGRAKALLEGEVRPLEEEARALALALGGTSEWELFRAAMVLEQEAKGDPAGFLDRVRVLVVDQLKAGGDPARLTRAADLLDRLRQAAQLNANPGQLAGWLCAGMYLHVKQTTGPFVRKK